MCIYIRYSISIIEKVFHYEENEITIIKCRDNIWFKAKQVATLLGYLDPGRSIRQNVDPEDRISLEKLIGKGGESAPPPLVSNFKFLSWNAITCFWSRVEYEIVFCYSKALCSI